MNIGLPRLLAKGTPSVAKSRNDYFANINNKVAFASASLWEAPCVLFHELLTQGVKTTLLYNFLTLIKFNFDSLSRKIKNPCLVINKFIIGGYSYEEYQNNFNRSIIVYALVFGKL